MNGILPKGTFLSSGGRWVILSTTTRKKEVFFDLLKLSRYDESEMTWSVPILPEYTVTGVKLKWCGFQ